MGASRDQITIAQRQREGLAFLVIVLCSSPKALLDTSKHESVLKNHCRHIYTADHDRSATKGGISVPRDHAVQMPTLKIYYGTDLNPE